MKSFRRSDALFGLSEGWGRPAVEAVRDPSTLRGTMAGISRGQRGAVEATDALRIEMPVKPRASSKSAAKSGVAQSGQTDQEPAGGEEADGPSVFRSRNSWPWQSAPCAASNGVKFALPSWSNASSRMAGPRFDGLPRIGGTKTPARQRHDSQRTVWGFHYRRIIGALNVDFRPLNILRMVHRRLGRRRPSSAFHV
jgi:hypothetical protein